MRRILLGCMILLFSSVVLVSLAYSELRTYGIWYIEDSWIIRGSMDQDPIWIINGYYPGAPPQGPFYPSDTGPYSPPKPKDQPIISQEGQYGILSLVAVVGALVVYKLLKGGKRRERRRKKAQIKREFRKQRKRLPKW